MTTHPSSSRTFATSLGEKSEPTVRTDLGILHTIQLIRRLLDDYRSVGS